MGRDALLNRWSVLGWRGAKRALLRLARDSCEPSDAVRAFGLRWAGLRAGSGIRTVARAASASPTRRKGGRVKRAVQGGSDPRA